MQHHSSASCPTTSHLVQNHHSSVTSHGSPAPPGSAHLGHNISAVTAYWTTDFSQGNLNTGPHQKNIEHRILRAALRCTLLHVQHGHQTCVMLHRSLGHRTNSAACCHTKACRQVPLCTGYYICCVALPVSNCAARCSHENITSL